MPIARPASVRPPLHVVTGPLASPVGVPAAPTSWTVGTTAEVIFWEVVAALGVTADSLSGPAILKGE